MGPVVGFCEHYNDCSSFEALIFKSASAPCIYYNFSLQIFSFSQGILFMLQACQLIFRFVYFILEIQQAQFH